MKRTITILAILFLVLCEFFSLDITTDDIFAFQAVSIMEFDPLSGNSFKRIDSHENFINRMIISEYKTSYESEDLKTIDLIKMNKDGFPVYYEYKSYERKEEGAVTYDSRGRITNWGNDWEYKYLDDNTREIYYMGKLNNKENITIQDDCIIIKSGTWITYEEKFIYNNDLLINYISNSYNVKGVASKKVRHDDFQYDDKNRIESILTYYGPDDIRCKQKVFYNDKGHMVKVEGYDGNEKTLNYIVNFSNHDEKGNFLDLREVDANGNLLHTVHRTIKYNDQTK